MSSAGNATEYKAAYAAKSGQLRQTRDELTRAMFEALADGSIEEEDKRELLFEFNKIAEIHQMLALDAEMDPDHPEESEIVKAANECLTEILSAEHNGQCLESTIEAPLSESNLEDKNVPMEARTEYDLKTPVPLLLSLISKQPLRTNMEVGCTYLSKSIEAIDSVDLAEATIDELDKEYSPLKEQLKKLNEASEFPFSLFPHNIRMAHTFSRDAHRFYQRVSEVVEATQLQAGMSILSVSSA